MYFGARHSYEMEREVLDRQARLIHDAAQRRLVSQATRQGDGGVSPVAALASVAVLAWQAVARSAGRSVATRRGLRPGRYPTPLW